MLIIERVVALSASPAFAEVPEHALAQLAAVAEEVTAEAGEIIIEQGREESWMFVLVDGSVSVTTAGTKLSELHPGAMIGELAVLDPEPRSATVTAAGPCLLLRIDRPALREVMMDQPELMLGIITMLVSRIRETNSAVSGAP